MRVTPCECWKPCYHEPFRIVAWTGGSAPRPIGTIGRWERQIVTSLFREQVDRWRGFWEDSPSRDTLRTFWRRARHDAHATARVYGTGLNRPR